jgi:diguanylate cyclase (GGDEF)-like protein/PAS domain S-box-containing protein
MRLHWFWIALGALALLVIWQQVRIYWIHRESKKREELFQIVTENAADMIALVDVKGRRLYNSPAYKRVLGYSAAELGETSAFEQIHPDDRFQVLEAGREARETGIGRRLEYRIKHKDGSWRVLESLASTIRDSDGNVAKMVIVNRDITERKRAEEQLLRNLFHDPLTGLANRPLILERLQAAFLKSRREPACPYALLLANVDHFKVFNESMGPAAGDQILQEIARRLGKCLRQVDTTARSESKDGVPEALLSRLGGDEFTVLLDLVSDPSDALRIAIRVQEAVAVPFTVDSREVRAALSIGIALSAPTQAQPDDVLKDAAAAMRRAKALGGSRCEVFDAAMHTRAVGRLRLEAELRTALAGQQFRVFYQPVVQLDTRQVVSFEALLRWEHPTQGLISPHLFVSAAEDIGILLSIGHWLLLQVCRQLREWEGHHVADHHVADHYDVADHSVNITLNISERQFADARLVPDIHEALQQAGVDPARLQLEMNEAVVAADAKLSLSVLSQLKHMGVGVILDDFGVGSASLRALLHSPLHALKIHQSLVREMQSDRDSLHVVELIVALAGKMNLKVIAEGIETARQVEHMRELGCEFGQGNFFSQPLRAEAAQEFLREQAPKPSGAAL